MIAAIIIVINLFLMEIMLSVDNAAVLAVMVTVLPRSQQAKALKYGILGGMIMRGASLFIASWLIHILWLKILGGLYLIYLAVKHFRGEEEEEQKNKRIGVQYVNLFWGTVILVELMDMAFSIDNIFASVAMTDNLYLIYAGVFAGMIGIRFVAQWFVILMRKFPYLEASAFIVIGALGIKLVVVGLLEMSDKYTPNTLTDICFSLGTMIIFFAPLLFNVNILKGGKDAGI